MTQAPVVIVDYDPAWPVRYAAEGALIRGAIGHIVAAIEHVGSTAVPGLGAKPIVDIIVGLHRLDDAVACVPLLEGIGYQYVPEYEAEMPFRRYFRKGTVGARTHHLHMVELGSEFWERHLLFRDYLRVHPEEARRYEELKRRLAAEFGTDRDGYTEAKTAFVRSIEAKARAAGPHPPTQT